MPNNPPYTSQSNPLGAGAPLFRQVNPFDLDNNGNVDRADVAVTALSASALNGSVSQSQVTGLAASLSGKADLVGGTVSQSQLPRIAAIRHDIQPGRDRDPVYSDNYMLGFASGSLWLNAIAGVLWMCALDGIASAGSATWHRISPSNVVLASGSPEALSYAPRGSLCVVVDNRELWVKTTNVYANTGWVRML